MLDRLDAHRDWANDLLIGWLANNPGADDYCRRMLTHVMTAEAVWLGRLRGEIPPKPSGEPLPVEELQALRLAHAPLWKAALATPSRVIAYANFAGAACESTVADIAAHLCLHGQYHRGQIAAQAARLGLNCPPTDFIVFARLD